MSITAHLDLHIKPAMIAEAPALITEVLSVTRAFDGCLGVDVLVDVADPTHFLVSESWETIEHDRAYRAFRATPEGASSLGTLLAGPPTLTIFSKSDTV